MSNNFVNNAVMGKYADTDIGEIPLWDDFIEWWNNLQDMIKYGIIAGAGLLAVVVIFWMIKPSNAGVRGVEQLEELLRLKMLKELAED